MDFSQIIHKIKSFKYNNLPGVSSHLKLAPQYRIKSMINADKSNAKESAVLLLLYPVNGDVFMPFIKRPVDDSYHSGQIAFPGGKYEEKDIDHHQTALREAFEEVGVLQNKVEVLNDLSPLFIPLSNFMVLPVIGASSEEPEFIRNPSEVDEIFNVSIKELLNIEIQNTKLKVRGNIIEVPAYNFNGKIIWGATAMILSEFIDILKK